MHRIASARFDSLAYGISCLLHLIISAYVGIFTSSRGLPWGTVLSTGLLFVAVDHFAVAYWLHKFSVVPTAIFCTIGSSILLAYCIFSLKLSSIFVYVLSAATVMIVLVSFRSSTVLDAYYRSIAAVASGSFLYLYVTTVGYALYLALAVSLVLYAFVLPFQTLGRRVEGLLVVANAIAAMVCATYVMY